MLLGRSHPGEWMGLKSHLLDVGFGLFQPVGIPNWITRPVESSNYGRAPIPWILAEPEQTGLEFFPPPARQCKLNVYSFMEGKCQLLQITWERSQRIGDFGRYGPEFWRKMFWRLGFFFFFSPFFNLSGLRSACELILNLCHSFLFFLSFKICLLKSGRCLSQNWSLRFYIL